ncbi:MAG: hypothetical protein MUF09_03080 [Candidatus Nanopelagicales bacterium]|jgi:hypothetical protein|nr:hypothetical protein [Candidatus Nanopelagicales bacterium]
MWARAWAGITLGAVLVAGCAGGAEEGPADQWPGGSSADLVPSGLSLAGGTGEGDVVVDGAGMVWVDGPWQVARVDPATGAATIWDAADDLAFASVRGLSPAQQAGVWLVSGDRARLFDGERFLVDLAVPAQYRLQGEGPGGEVLQVGEELWASGAAGVGRWVDGSWAAVGSEQLRAAGPLARDSQGAVWAAGASTVDEDNVVVRFDGTTWVTPGNAVDAPSGVIVDIAADPSGGVWVASTQDGPTTDQHGIYRFDGTTWSKAGPGGYAHDMAVTTDGTLWAMVGAGNGIDPTGEVRVASLAADGTWEAFGSEEGAPEGGEVRWPSLAVAGDTVLVSDVAGLVRGEGARFTGLWQDPAAVVRPAFGVAHGQAPDALVAVSAEEAWLPVEEGLRPTAPGGGYNALARLREGAWVTLGPPTRGDTENSPVLATDGAVWQVTGQGLVRILGETASVVSTDVGGYSRISLAAGEDGSVWTVSAGDVVQVRPDGSIRSIGRPEGSRPFPAATPLAVGPGVVWLAESTPGTGDVRLARWGGGWSYVESPRAPNGMSYTWAAQIRVGADGAVWAIMAADEESMVLSRYADSGWTVDDGWARALAATPAGEMCAIREEGVACYDAAGLATGTAVNSPVPVDAVALGIAADGTAWVLGEQVARLPEGATGSAG